jgi:hypothetical protein
VQNGDITLVFYSHSLNPHIKRLSDLPVDQQLSKLSVDPISTICAYPSAAILKAQIDESQYATRPFTRRLALAEPQLEAVYFDLAVVERYQRDPRYIFEFHDFGGSISLHSTHAESGDVPARDQVFLQTFGIGYDQKRRRVVLSFLRYLGHLSPEHQQVWAAHVVDDKCTSNSDYFRSAILGEWPEYYSAYEAFLQERRELNILSQLIGKEPLFVGVSSEGRPSGFHPMLRPTKQNFADFIHLLDKLLSESLNRDFFKGDLELERRVPGKNGVYEVERPGTLKLLEEWLSKYYRTANGEDVGKEVLKPMRDIRSMRQKPAHTIEGNDYDEKYPKEQDRLLEQTLRRLTKLRLILESHPLARKRYTPPDWLDSDRIVFY